MKAQSQQRALHITSGDSSGGSLAQSGVPGDVLVWHDVLYDGPRNPGWPSDATLHARAAFLEQTTGGGLSRAKILVTLHGQYERLAAAGAYERVVLWFDACLFDQAMLAHVLACLDARAIRNVDLLCVDAFPGIQPYNGLGQLTPAQLASIYDRRQPVTPEHFAYALTVDRAFALQDQSTFLQLAGQTDVPLPWIPAAVRRWLQEQPDAVTGFGRLEQLGLEAVRAGCDTPARIFAWAAARDTPPQFWGDTMLWAKLNALADRRPPLVRIEGPVPRLPQWDGVADLKAFRVYPTEK